MPAARHAAISVLGCLASSAIAAEAAEAAEGAGFWDALSGGEIALDLRFRIEAVDQSGLPEDALAALVDVELGYVTRPWHGVRAGIEFEYVAPLDEDGFSSPSHPDPERPVVADPEGAELNQFWLGWNALPELELTLGRQRIDLDNQRHVGAVAWRLNEQTFDAVLARSQLVPMVELLAIGIGNVNTTAGENVPFEHAVLLHAAADLEESFELEAEIAAYVYLLDFADDDFDDQFTVGARGDGACALSAAWKLLWTLDVAWQGAYADRDDFAAPCLHGVVGVQHALGRARIGVEVLGSDDGAAAVQTPLGTRHAFNGWADKFLTTPADGLIDLYLELAPSWPALPALKTALIAHDFLAHEGDAHYGFEIDALVAYSWGGGIDIGAKLALYDADDFATDTAKCWLWVHYGF